MIHIISNYYVSIDNGSYTLLRLVEGKAKNGEPKKNRNIIGYFGSLKACLKRCETEVLADGIAGNVVTLAEAMALVREVGEKLEKCFEREGL